MRLMAFTLALTLCALVSSGAYSETPAEREPEEVFLGYVLGMPEDINYSLYTHLAHAFLGAGVDGSVQLRAQVPSRDLTREAHKAGVQVLISLGGGGNEEPFVTMAQDLEAEDRYVREVMRVVDEYDYDGIDFDWEYPDSETEVECFERMTRQFRRLLDELGRKKRRVMRLTMAVNCHPDQLKWLTNELLLENMDWINLMTYDFTGPWRDFAGHHSPLYVSQKAPKDGAFSTESAVQYLIRDRGYPADRLTLGIPLYGRLFAVDTPYASTVGASKPRREALIFRDIAELKNDPNWVRWWDDETKSPWLLATGRSEIICYDDVESIALKQQWAEKHGLRGVFFWQIDGDRMPDGSNPLQEAAKKEMRR